MKNMLVLAVLLSSAQACALSFRTAPVAPAAATVAAAAPAVVTPVQKANVVARAYKAVAGSISSAASYTATKAVNGAKAVKNTVSSAAGSVAKSVVNGKNNTVAFVGNHKTACKVTAAVAVTAVTVAALYNYNEAFRNKVRSLLGLDKTEEQVA